MKFGTSSLVVGLHVLAGISAVSGDVFAPLDVYQPRTIVSDRANVNLDFEHILAELDKGTRTGFATATRIYQEGAYSGSIAELVLVEPLDVDVPRGTILTGQAYDSSKYTQVSGKTFRAHSKGDRTIEVAYDAIGGETASIPCKVGGNPTPTLEGCKY